MAGAIRLICSPHCPSGWATPVAFSACIAGRRTYHRQGSCGREVPSVHWPELLMHFYAAEASLAASVRQTDRQTDPERQHGKLTFVNLLQSTQQNGILPVGAAVIITENH